MKAERLRNDPQRLSQYVRSVSRHTKIPIPQVEKDFWITEVLRGAIAWSHREKVDLVWRGGTSLSKAHRVIQRFSEDVDLVVMLPATHTTDRHDRQLNQSRLDALEQACALTTAYL